MELPFYLRTLPPEALEIIRFYRMSGVTIALSQAITDGTGLSDRGFGKGIRRLVTKGYLVLDGDQRYRLTDFGRRAVDEFVDDGSPQVEDTEIAVESRAVERRLVLVLPKHFVAEQAVNVYAGFLDADSSHATDDPLNLLLRLSVVNGEPATARESPFLLDSQAVRQAFEVTPGHFTRARVRVQVYQPGDDLDDTRFAGGMYVDVDVLPPGSAAEPDYTAYGTDIQLIATG